MGVAENLTKGAWKVSMPYILRSFRILFAAFLTERDQHLLGVPREGMLHLQAMRAISWAGVGWDHALCHRHLKPL